MKKMKTILAILGILTAVVFAVFRSMNTSSGVAPGPSYTDASGGILTPNRTNTPHTPHHGGTSSYPDNFTPKGASEVYTPPPPVEKQWVSIPYQKVGLIDSVTTEEKIKRSYGEANVRREIVGREWGETIPATIVYPDTKNQLTIEWKEGLAYKKIEKIRIENEGATWQTAEGIHVGMPLSELIRINGKEFKFYGFEWDYSGMVTDWNGGNIKDGTIVFLTPNNPAAVIPAMLGDSLYSTTTPSAAEAGLYVESIEIKM